VDSETVIAIETAVILRLPWPPAGVPDTPATRGMRDQITSEIAALPDGVAPDIPNEWPAP
jgi:hypothetical protein